LNRETPEDNWHAARRLKDDPMVRKFTIDVAAPTRPKQRKEMLLPNEAASQMLIFEPNWANCRRDIPEAPEQKSNTLQLRPTFRYDRSEMELPRVTKLVRDTCKPTRRNCLSEIVDPNLTASITDATSWNLVLPNTEKEDCARWKARNESDDPNAHISIMLKEDPTWTHP
jgi:hypothetical protein